MSGSTRQAATRILRQLGHPQRHYVPSAISAQPPSLVRRSITQQYCQQQQKRCLSMTHPVKSNDAFNSKPSGSIEKPPTTVREPSATTAEETMVSDLQENAKSIEQVIAELHRDTRIVAPATYASNTPSSLLLDGSAFPAAADHTGYTNAGAEGPFSSSASEPRSPSSSPESSVGAAATPKKRSRFWFYIYHILYWSALGSLPVHLLMFKGEAKEVKEKQEWRIGVLTEMRDKLQRGESVEEEEALLSVGMNRNQREEQVDDKYFEDLLVSAEKLDFVFGKDKDAAVSDHNTASQVATGSSPTSAPVSAATAAAPPSIPRKPAPPKSERSFL